MDNEKLATQFTKEGNIKDQELADKFLELVQEYPVFCDQEVKITDLGFEKEVEYEEEFWTGNPDDISPSYISRTETVHMEYYSECITPTDLDICLYFNKEPQDITKEDCEGVDPEYFNKYLEEVYKESLYYRAEEEFYGNDYSD